MSEVKIIKQQIRQLRKQSKKLQEEGFEDFMAGKGTAKYLRSKEINKTINILLASLEQQSSSGQLDKTFKKQQDHDKMDFFFNTYKR